MRQADLKHALESMSSQPERLIAIIMQQAERIKELEGKLQKVSQQIETLKPMLEQAQREAKRQAAPFRRPDDKKVDSPKRPGRKNGHKGSYRRAPDQIDQLLDIPLRNCPSCAVDLSSFKHRQIVQTIIELPIVKPKVIRLLTYQCECPNCHNDARSTHPLQVSYAEGAASTYLGPRAIAAAAMLNKDLSLTMRKTCRILAELFDLPLSPGGLSQAMDRVADRLSDDYVQLQEALKNDSVVHADETSWYLNGKNAWLWVFTNDQHTYYHIDERRNRQVIDQIIGEDYRGVFVSDCLNIYDNLTQKQQKCHSHHAKAISNACKLHTKNGDGFLRDCQTMLRASRALKPCKNSFTSEQFKRCRKALDKHAKQLLHPARDDPAEESVRKRLAKQIDHLFTFLDFDGVDATNNLAERQLRPAVIARKLSCGNKTASGANTWKIIASIAASCRQQSSPFLDNVANAMSIGR